MTGAGGGVDERDVEEAVSLESHHAVRVLVNVLRRSTGLTGARFRAGLAIFRGGAVASTHKFFALQGRIAVA